MHVVGKFFTGSNFPFPRTSPTIFMETHITNDKK